MFIARVIGRLLRRLLILGIKVPLQHPISTLIIVALLGIIFLMGGSPATARGNAAPSAVTSSGSSIGPRPAAPEQWLQGYKEFDANIVWASMSDLMKQDMQNQGETVASLQKKLDDAKAAGNTIVSSDYVARYVTEDGHTIYFYVVILRDGVSGQTAHVPFTFITDVDGKLLRVE